MASDPRRQGPQGPGRGFVLVVTLWILAGIAIVVALVSLWAIEQVQEASGARADLDDELARLGVRDSVLYLAATRDLTLAGLPVDPLPEDERASRLLDEFGSFDRSPIGGELRLDGTPYAGPQGVSFALQDESGLMPLTWPDPAALDRFLRAQGAEPAEVPALRDALLDYIDSDDLRRLNGAETREYERAGRPPPAQRRLLLPTEALRAMGWDKLPPAARDRLPDLVSTFYAGAVNLNTMPRELLPAWLGECGETCDALVSRREREPFRSAAQVQLDLGLRLPGDEVTDYRFLASDTLRLTLWGRRGAAYRIHVRLTPLASRRAPWAVLAAYPVPRPDTDEPPTPTGSDLFSDPAAAGR